MTNKRYERLHIVFANLIAFLLVMLYIVARMLNYFITEQHEMLVFHLIVSAVTLVTMLIIYYVCAKRPQHLGFFVPGFIVVVLLFSDYFLEGGVPVIYIALAGLCPLSGAYLNFKSYIRFVLFLNFLLFIRIVVLGIPLAGTVVIDTNAFDNWMLIVTCSVAVGITVHYAAARDSKSEVAMKSFHTMLATTPNIVALVDELNRVTFISEELANLANVVSADLCVGRPLLDLFADPDMFDMMADVLDSGKSFENTLKVNVDGEARYFKIISVQMGGDLKGRLIDITDITPIMRARYEAEGASRAKSDFLSKMSHEIRTPMNAIIGMAELILREELSGEAREQAATIKQSGGHLLSIINDILDFSKIESGKMEIVNSQYLFHSTINDVISIIKMRKANPDLRFVVFMQHNIPNELYGDEVRLRQVLLNVLSNAVKYTPEGYFVLEITCEKTTKPENREKGSVGTVLLTIRVKDTGIGIKPEDISKLFGEFSQFDVERNRNTEGTGLGLAITRNLLKLMGGTIEVLSEYGKGSEFILTLPQKYNLHDRVNGVDDIASDDKSVLLYCRTPVYTEYIARSLEDLGTEFAVVKDNSDLHVKLQERKWGYVFAEEELAYTANNIAKARGAHVNVIMMSESLDTRTGSDFPVLAMPVYSLTIVNALNGEDAVVLASDRQVDFFTAPNANVLIVDDIHTNLTVGKGLLKPYGMNVDTLTGGAEAIEAVKTNDYDILLMDHMMPEMDGVDAVKIIRGIDGGKYAKLPIIALTANAIVGAKEMFLQNGFNDFLSKPIETVKLNAILTKWLPKGKQIHSGVPRPVAEKEPIADITIEGVNTAKGIAFSGGRADNYWNTLKVFRKDGVKKTTELERCLNDNDLRLYTTYVHALKSACANIGADKLSGEAKLLEEAGLKQNVDYITKNNPGFINSLKKLIASVDEAVTANDETAEVKTLDTAVLKEGLAKLKTALEDFDVGSIDEVSKSLRDFTQMPDIGDIIGDIIQNAFIGDYEEAESQIEALLPML